MNNKLAFAKPDFLPALEAGPLFDILAEARSAMPAGETRNFTCAIINVKSGRCSENCVFCAQSSHYNTNVSTYPFLSPDEILAKTEALIKHGVDYVGLVSSGQKLSAEDFSKLQRTARLIKARFDIRLCASAGLLAAPQARALKEAGFSSYHHNLESSPEYFPRICTTHEYEQSLETIKAAKAADLRVCAGGLFGLGESWAQRLQLAELLSGLEVDSIPINFLMPIKGTPLQNRALLSAAEALKIIALFRLVNLNKDIVICGGRGHILGHLKSLVFAAGANGVMIGDYLTAKGDEITADLQEMLALGVK